MGQQLSAWHPNPVQPGTYILRMVLACDGCRGLIGSLGLLGRTHQTYEGEDYMAMRAAAHQDGWRRRNGGWYSAACCGRVHHSVGQGALALEDED